MKPQHDHQAQHSNRRTATRCRKDAAQKAESPRHRRCVATRLLRSAFVLCVSVGLFTAGPAAAQDAADQPIAFGEIESTFARGVAEERVTVVYFTADWCAVCRKMERVVYADPAVRAAAAPFEWAKVDLDASPELAAMFGVRGVPHLALLNVHGEILYERSGALNVSSMLELLSEYDDQATAPGAVRARLGSLGELTERVEDASGQEPAASDDVLELVLLLAEPNPIGAQETTQRLIGMGSSVWPGLVEAMGHERLAVRAAAFDLLRESAEHNLPFDPFIEAQEREPMRAAWQAWVSEQLAETQADTDPEQAEQVDPAPAEDQAEPAANAEAAPAEDAPAE